MRKAGIMKIFLTYHAHSRLVERNILQYDVASPDKLEKFLSGVFKDGILLFNYKSDRIIGFNELYFVVSPSYNRESDYTITTITVGLPPPKFTVNKIKRINKVLNWAAEFVFDWRIKFPESEKYAIQLPGMQSVENAETTAS